MNMRNHSIAKRTCIAAIAIAAAVTMTAGDAAAGRDPHRPKHDWSQTQRPAHRPIHVDPHKLLDSVKDTRRKLKPCDARRVRECVAWEKGAPGTFSGPCRKWRTRIVCYRRPNLH